MIMGLIFFLLGICIGSFLNSFLWRYENKFKYSGRSICPKCKHTIPWYDNVPLISYIMLSGKCRFCKKQISLKYPSIELITGIFFLLAGISMNEATKLEKYFTGIIEINNNEAILSGISLTVISVLIAGLVLIAVYDYKHQEIPNGFNLLFFATAVLYLIISSYGQANPMVHLGVYSLAAIVGFLIFYLLVFFSKETWLGGGDAKMMLGMGILLGPSRLFFAVLVASIIGSVYGIILISVGRGKEKPSLKSEVPFGPFLALGTLVALFYGQQIIDIYVKIFIGY